MAGDLQLFEKRLHISAVGTVAVDDQIAVIVHVDFVGVGGQQILVLAVIVALGDDLFAAFLERSDLFGEVMQFAGARR